MKTLFKTLLTALLSVVLTGPVAHAQERPAFTQAELDQMLAPIALYPDPLLSQILMASTYPVEVVQAARWSRANAPLDGEEAVRAAEPMAWDPSVKSLVAFPRVLDRMDEQLDWTERLGEAFLTQESQVMDTIQDLRWRADAAGNLAPGEEMRIVRDGRYIRIEPASPQIVYVPYYDPLVVYGAWRWPAYRPVRWSPWPGYYVRKMYAPRFVWGGAIVFRSGFFFGAFSWPQRQVVVVHRQPAPVVVTRQVTIVRTVTVDKPERWQHDARHRRDAPLRHVGLRNSNVAHPVPTRKDAQPDPRSGVMRSPLRSVPETPARVSPPAPRGPDKSATGTAARETTSVKNPSGELTSRRSRGSAQASPAEPRHTSANVPPRDRMNRRPDAPSPDAQKRENAGRETPSRNHEASQSEGASGSTNASEPRKTRSAGRDFSAQNRFTRP